ncbi:hypothetical protein CYMTET_46492 [Cymbomonas tetramitiformis]|uniref:Sugar phosphate transporter domain-containing protein n=1 Tax=Cymbomonas tetramitiformis TaxID=36881 RepID=A0AAE0EXK0_9CHLO|nr:hypothetical protein CYMTET_46492 [Cymbomonas tetramitiformis]
MGGKRTVWEQASACLAYGTISVTLTLTQKTVFQIYTFNYPAFVTLMQILTSLSLMHSLKAMGYIEFQTFRVGSAKQTWPLAASWWLYVVSGVTALRYLNVPMFSVLRRITTILVVLGEIALFNKRPSPASGVALLMMTAGAVIAGATDLTYNFLGYFYVSVCVVSTAAYLLLIRRLREQTGLDEISLLYYNNFLGLPLMALWLLFGTDELRDVFSYPHITSPFFVACLLFSAAQAFALNICIFRCTSINSPLATSVTGQIKDIATTGLGMFLFGDVVYTSQNMLGLSVGLGGGMLYSAISYVNSVRASQNEGLAKH